MNTEIKIFSRNLILILFVLVLDQCGLIAQWNNIDPITLSPRDGLNCTNPTTYETRNGKMYFGTICGLYSYDGSTFEIFSPNAHDSKSIGAGTVLSFLEGTDGIIWIGLSSDGLNRYDPISNTFRRIELPGETRRNYDVVRALYEDDEGNIWIGANDFRLFKYNPVSEEIDLYVPDFYDKTKPGRHAINRIVPDVRNEDILWISVIDYPHPDSEIEGAPLLSFNTTNGSFQFARVPGSEIVQDSNGMIWRSRFLNGLSLYNPEQDNFKLFPEIQLDHEIKNNTRIRSMKLLDGNLHISTNYGLYRQVKNNRFELSLPQSNTIDFGKFHRDKNGQFWLRNINEVFVIPSRNHPILNYSFAEHNVTPIYFSDLHYDQNTNRIYVACGGHNIESQSLFSIEPKRNGRVDKLDLGWVPDGISGDGDGRLFVAGNGTIYLIESVDSEPTIKKLETGNSPLPWLWSLNYSDEGWVAGCGKKEIVYFHKDSLNVNRVLVDNIASGQRYIYEGRRGLEGLVMGRNEKAYVYSNDIIELDLPSGKIRELQFDKSIFGKGDDFIYDLNQDESGLLWMMLIDKTAIYRIEGDSLVLEKMYGPGDAFFQMASEEVYFSDDHIWLMGQFGITGTSKLDSTKRNFGVGQGLPHLFMDPRNIITLPDGKISTIYSGGLILFHPDSLWAHSISGNFETIIKEIRVNGKLIESDTAIEYINEVKLPVNTQVIDIGYQALAFPKDGDVVYSYRLLGQSSDWVYTQNNKRVSFSGLSPGQYTFEIKASSPNDKSKVRRIYFSIPTPFFKRPFVKLLLILFGIALIGYLLYRRQRKKYKEEVINKERQRQVMEYELKALRSQMNPHFMFNSLNAIKSYILQSEPQLAAEYLSDFAHLIRQILQNSREKLITLNKELEALFLYIDLEKLRSENKFDFHCTVQDGVDLDSILIPPLLLQPFVENAIWHGLTEKGQGILSIDVSIEGDKVYCIVEDNGVGREASIKRQKSELKKYRSLGMGITKDRMNLINELEELQMTIELEDLYSEGVAAGTRVIISFKKETE